MAVKIYKTKIAEKEQLSSDTYRLRINFDEPFEFQGGQFVNILVAPNTRRSYSIASSPEHTGYIDLIADTVMGGPGSMFFKNSKQGDDIEILGPLGHFVYHSDDKPAYFFATGTGVVPFMSMIDYALRVEKSQRQMLLFLGFRFEENIFKADYFARLTEEFPNFQYILTLTQPSSQWQGHTGRITAHYQPLIEKDQNFDAYICGSHQMIDDVKERLLKAGVNSEQIYYEQFY